MRVFSRHRTRPVIDALEPRALLAAGLVRDINRIGPTNVGTQLELTEVDGSLFFVADDGAHGAELWHSDGTAAGTRLVKDLRPGPSGSGPQNLTSMNGVVYFGAQGGTSGFQLWRSDGTEEGTRVLADVEVFQRFLAPVRVIGDAFYFCGRTGNDDGELWRSDGTAAGTWRVKDIMAGPSGSYPRELTTVGATLYFTVRSSPTAHHDRLWRSDGTSEGTWPVPPGDTNAVSAGTLASHGGYLYCGANGPVGRELYRTDGSASGLTLVEDLNLADSSNPRELTSAGGLLYFVADDHTRRAEVWRSDGTPQGTYLLRDIVPNKTDQPPRELTAVGQALFFAANAYDGGNSLGYELWTSDGTEAGTRLVKDIDAGGASGFNYGLTDVSGTAYLVARDATRGDELWKSDGTPEGTLAIELCPGPGGSGPAAMAAVGAALYLSASDGAHGHELWRVPLDGAAPPLMIRPISAFTHSAGVGNVTSAPEKPLSVLGDRMYFASNDGLHGAELWHSDGTAAGTALVKDLFPGASHGDPQYLTRLGQRLVFAADDGAAGRELWASDGTAAGTALLADLWPGPAGSDPRLITAGTASAPRAFFVATRPDSGSELWATDGTANGTYLVKDIHPGTASSTPHNLFLASDGTLYFGANDGVHGAELWKSDGSEAGTVLVKDLSPDAAGTSIWEFTEYAGHVYFAADELYRTDGSEAGTFMVRDIRPGNGTSGVRHFQVFNGLLFFNASGGSVGAELWASDGTEDGTRLFKDLAPGSASSTPLHMTAVGGAMYFQAWASGAGIELWRSDGTPSGTVMVRDIRPGTNGSEPRAFRATADTLYFSAADGFGRRVYRTDGTAAGTVLVAGNYTADADGPRAMTLLGQRLYFGAADWLHGLELWTSDGDTAAPTTVAHAFAFDARPQAVSVTFSEDVRASVEPLDLWLVNRTTGQTVLESAIAVVYDGLTHRTDFSFPGYANGVLPDGRYRATLSRADVEDASSNFLSADLVFDFDFLNADANRDGHVNLLDFNRLAANFGQSSRTFSQGDFNYDGAVNLLDFNILAGRFGAVLAADGTVSGAGSARLPSFPPPRAGGDTRLGGATDAGEDESESLVVS